MMFDILCIMLYVVMYALSNSNNMQ
jgi:hypothetical protein